MEIRRFYVEPRQIVDGVVTIEGEEYRHMTNVLRYKVGYKAIVCDNSGRDYLCTVTAIDKQRTLCRVDEIKNNDTELGYRLTLCLGQIKPEKLEIAVQKAVEIGAHEILLFVSGFTSQIKINEERVWRIVKEACKQCGRAILPTVRTQVPWQEVLALDCDKVLAYENAQENTWTDIAPRLNKSHGIAVIIGSEGGLSEEEIKQATLHNVHIVTLGKRILRAETAAIVCLANAVCLLGE